MLWFAVAGAIPIIIHLLNRQRYQKVRWAAMEFLLEALKKTRRRLQIENLLLLLIRVMVLFLLTLALSRCYFRESPLVALGTVDTHAIIALDNSYSMDYKTGNKTCFEQGRKIALRLVDSLKTSQGDKVSVLTMARPPVGSALVSEGSVDLKKVKKSIANLVVSDFRADLFETFQQAKDIIDQSDKTRKIFYVVTDMQRVVWEMPPTRQQEFMELITEVSKKAEVQIIDVSKPEPANFLVTKIEPSRKIITTDTEVTFRAEIRNHSPHVSNHAQVNFIVDNFPQNTTTVNLPAQGVGTVSFNYEFIEPGPHWVEIKVEADNLAIDNSRYFVVDVKEALKILIINGEPGVESFEDEVIFLRYALNPSRSEVEKVSIYSLESISDIIFEETDVKKYDLVILANVSFLSQAKVKNLEEYVSAGGGLLVFLGDKIDRTIYNELLYKNGNGLLPAELGLVQGDQSHEEAFSLDRLDFTHGALEYLRPLKSQFGKMVIYEFYQAKTDPDRKDVRVLAWFNDVDSSPAMIEKLFGKGKVMLVTTSADAEWNLMPGRKLYVMVYDQMVMYLAAQPFGFKNILVGQPLQLLIKTHEYAKNFSLVTPQQGMSTISPVQIQDKGFVLTYNRTERHGIYTLNRMAEAGGESELSEDRPASPMNIGGPAIFSYLAVNVDPQEGNLEQVKAEELKQLYPNFKFRKLGELSKTSEAEITKPPPSSIWKYLVYAVLFLLVLESILAQRFGAFKK